MSLEKAIEYRKEKRKPYRGSKRWDHTCRNHGSCSYCENNRTIQSKREMDRASDQETELYTSCYLDELVSGNMTDGKAITVEEWNAMIDEHYELRYN
jgi:hypothetical protein